MLIAKTPSTWILLPNNPGSKTRLQLLVSLIIAKEMHNRTFCQNTRELWFPLTFDLLHHFLCTIFQSKVLPASLLFALCFVDRIDRRGWMVTVRPGVCRNCANVHVRQRLKGTKTFSHWFSSASSSSSSSSAAAAAPLWTTVTVKRCVHYTVILYACTHIDLSFDVQLFPSIEILLIVPSAAGQRGSCRVEVCVRARAGGQKGAGFEIKLMIYDLWIPLNSCMMFYSEINPRQTRHAKWTNPYTQTQMLSPRTAHVVRVWHLTLIVPVTSFAWWRPDRSSSSVTQYKVKDINAV